MCIIRNFFHSSKSKNMDSLAACREFVSMLCTSYTDRTWTLQTTFFWQHQYAADIKKIYMKDKLQTLQTHIWESDVLSDKLRDKFEAGVRDAVLWSELTFIVCYFNPSNREFSATADHVRRAEHSSDRPTNTVGWWLCCAEPRWVVLCCRPSRQPAFTWHDRGDSRLNLKKLY